MSIPTLISLFVSVTVAIAIVANNVSAVSQHPKLLVVSYDAFRYDYFERNLTPFMNKLRSEGTHSDYMQNIFVTKTFPNHHSMATGFFAETHGVVGNTVFDPDTGTILPKKSYKMYHYNNKIAPFWIYNEKTGAGRHSGVMMWPGSEHEYIGISPTFFQLFNESWPWETRVDRLISWFTDPKTPINLGILYMEEPDNHGHALGINSPDFNAIIEKLDRFTKYIHDKLNENGLQDVNVVHLSDHGMQTITKERIIDLDQFVNQSDYSIVESSAALQIFPVAGKLDLVHRQLVEGAKSNGHFTVYKREEIPEKYHYGKNPRIAPIFIVADIRYAFSDIYNNIKYWEKKYNFTSNNQTEFGVHGYDSEEKDMRAMFFAYGPVFKKHYKLEPFNNTDLFPLFCKILELSCPAVNGTLERVESCLQASYYGNTFESGLAVVGVLIMVGCGVFLAAFIIKRRRNRASTYRRILTSESDGEYLWNEYSLESDTA